MLEYIIIFIAIIVIAIVFAQCYRQAATVMLGGAVAQVDYARDYQRWETVTEMMHVMSSYESLNILERWIIGNANLKSEDVVFAPETPELDKIFVRECNEKKVTNMLTRISELRAKYLSAAVPISAPNVTFTATEITVGKFRLSVAADRLKKMRCRATDSEVAQCALRYGALIQRGQQWSIPADIYAYLADLGATIEGFASPFNSQNMMLDLPFCSLFESDRVFGSIGDFFNADFGTAKIVIINPPFIVDILDRAAELAQKLATAHTVVFVGPNWTDTKFARIMREHRAEIMEKNTYAYQNAEGLVPARFQTLLTVLGKTIHIDGLGQKWRSIVHR